MYNAHRWKVEVERADRKMGTPSTEPYLICAGGLAICDILRLIEPSLQRSGSGVWGLGDETTYGDVDVSMCGAPPPRRSRSPLAASRWP